jgi:hypothetical protein
MRPIPAPRIGDSHGLIRAIDSRGRLRMDEFVTEFSIDELYPPELENALGRTRQFMAYARAAGLVREDRGIVELSDVGRRYIRAGSAERPYDVVPAQAEWLRRLLREKHMTDSIYHGAAIALSLLASSPGLRVPELEFGRALSHLGRAGWDNENTLAIQGERHLTLLRDLELIREDWTLTGVGEETRAELTLPVHASMADLAGAPAPAPAPDPEPVPVADDGYEDVVPVAAATQTVQRVEAPTMTSAPAFLAGAAIRAAASARGLALGEPVFANLAAALAGGRHVLIVGPEGSGKTTLAVAVAEAAVAAGRTPGLTVVTAGESLGRQALAAGRTGRWLVADELERAPAGWASGAFLAGLAVTIGSDAVSAPADWRIVATAPSAPPGLPGAFAVVDVGPHPDLEAAIRAAAGGDEVAAAAVIGLLPGDGRVGAGRFLAAAAHAVARRAEAPADEATLAREVQAAYRL